MIFSKFVTQPLALSEIGIRLAVIFCVILYIIISVLNLGQNLHSHQYSIILLFLPLFFNIVYINLRVSNSLSFHLRRRFPEPRDDLPAAAPPAEPRLSRLFSRPVVTRAEDRHFPAMHVRSPQQSLGLLQV